MLTNMEDIQMENAIYYAKKSCDTMMRIFDAPKLPPEGKFHYHQGVFLSGMQKVYEVCGEHINHLPCRQVVTRNALGHSRDGSENVFEMAIDVMVYNPDDNKIEIIRFGDGKDRKVL